MRPEPVPPSVDPSVAPAADSNTNPYVGPRTFSEAQGKRFFGREREARDLIARCVSERLLLFYAQSGAGKSSLLNTRIMPQLRDEEGFQVLPVGRVSGELPAGVDAVANIFVFSLMVSLDQSEAHPARLAQLTLSEFLARLAGENIVGSDGQRTRRWVYKPGAVVASPATSAPVTPAKPGPRFALIIDQFEEIITSHPARWAEREEFFRQLDQAMRIDPNLWVVLTLREDYVAALDPYAQYMADRLRARFYMERMGVEPALQAIQLPAMDAGRPFAAGVAETLVDNLRRVKLVGQTEEQLGQSIEPVQLQVVCYQLWAQVSAQGSQRAEITLADLQQFGDVDRALADFYASALTAVLSHADSKLSERQLRAWFDKELITEAGTRGTVYQGLTNTAGLPNPVIKLLADQFLLRSEQRAGGYWVELVHDRFVEPILAANRAWEAAHQDPLTQTAQAWLAADKSPTLLLSSGLLTAARTQLKAQPDEFDEITHEFVDTSETVETQRQTRRWRLQLGVVIGLCLILLLFTSWAVRNAQRASEARVIAEINANAAADAQATAETAHRNETIALQSLVAQNLVDKLENPQSSSLLLIDAITRTHQVQIISPVLDLQRFSANLSAIGGLPLTGHTGAVNSVRFSPNERWLATAGEDHIVRLWDVQHPFTSPLSLTGHIAAVTHLAFSPDGQWLASGSRDYTIRVWDLTTSPVLAQTLSYAGDLYRVIFSPSGRWLLTTSSDGLARVWDMQTLHQASPPRQLTHDYGYVIDATFSADEQTLATMVQDGFGHSQVKLWRPDAGFTVEQSDNDYPYLASMAMSPDGRWLAVSTDAEIQIRQLVTTTNGTPTPIQHYPGFGYNNTLFSPDSRFFSNGNTLWSLGPDDRWDEPLWLNSQPSGSVSGPVFSQDSRWLVALGSDYSAYRWDLQDVNKAPYVYRGHEDALTAAAFSASGQWLATSSREGVTRLWRTAAPIAMPLILHHDDLGDTIRVWNMNAADPALDTRLVGPRPANYRLVTIGPDGRYIAAAYESNSPTILLWDTTKPLAQPLSLLHDNVVTALAFSPDGHWLAVSDWSGLVRLWDLSASFGAEPAHLDFLHPASVRALAFSDDSTRLVTGTGNPSVFDYIVRVWNLTVDNPTSQQPQALGGHTSIVRTVAISPGGRWVLSGTWEPDLTARLWDLHQPDPAAHPIILPFKGRLFAVGFSPDEQWAAAASWDTTAQLVNLRQPDAPPIVLAQHRGRILSLTFTADSHWLVTGGEDERILLWDLTTDNPAVAPVALRSPTGSGTGVGVAFSPDGRWLAGFGAAAFSKQGAWLVTADNDVHLWNLHLNELIDTTCIAVGRNLSRDEWARYFPDQPYRTVCPALAQNQLVPRLQAQALLHDGDQLAVSGQVTAALTIYQQATALDPALAVGTVQAANQRAVFALLEAGKVAVQAGELETATKRFTQAQALDPALNIEPADEAEQLAAQALVVLVDQATSLAQNGETAAAIAKVEAAQPIAQTLNLTAFYLRICRLQTFPQLAPVTAVSCRALAAQTPTIQPGSPVSDTVDNPDGDWWQLKIAASSLVTITLSALDDSSLDPYLILYDNKFDIVAEHDDIEAGVIQDSALNAVALAQPGLYWVVAGRCCPGNDQESAGAYTLEVTVKQAEE